MIENMLKYAKTAVAGLGIVGSLALGGCQAIQHTVETGAQYFRSVAQHEGAHALTARLSGASNIHVDVLPSRTPEGVFYGYTSYDGRLDPTESLIMSASGSGSQFLTSRTVRHGLLETGIAPDYLQPFLAKGVVIDDILLYLQLVLGIMGKGDFGKHEELAIASVGIIGAEILYETIVGILDPQRSYLKLINVALGRDRYSEEASHLPELIFMATDKGVQCQLRFGW